MTFVSGGEDFFSSHASFSPRFALLDESFDGCFSFGTLLVGGGCDVRDLFAVSGDDDGFASFDGAEEFGEFGFGICCFDLEHEVGFLTCCFNYIAWSVWTLGFELAAFYEVVEEVGVGF